MLKKFPLLFLVLLIEGGALMAVELMGAKLVAPFYGGSLYVWTAVLTIAVLGLTLGYYFGGQLARKQASETKLFIILGISAFLVLALPLTASLSMAFTSGMGLITGICVTCVLLLLPPMLCFGIVGPMVVSLMSTQLESVGKTAGTVYFTSTLGGIAATFFLGLYFIPVAGLRLCSAITGLALAALPAVYSIRSLLAGRRADAQPAKRSKASSKKSASKGRVPSPIRGPDVKRSIYLFAVLEGATVMAVELIAARMVAPYFGSSLYVWATVIGFTLFALAIGYFSGGVIADKYSSPDTLLWILLIASVFLMLMHVSASLLTIAFENISPGAAVILVSLILILPPLIFMGMVPTILIRKVSAAVDYAGTSTGRVYAISSASGIVALPLFGFFIIPRLGLTLPSILVGIAVGFIPFIELISRKKYVSLLFIPCVLSSFWAIKAQRPGNAVAVRYYSEGLLGQLLVADVSNTGDQKINERFLLVNRIGQTRVERDTFASIWKDVYSVGAICSKLPAKSNALILGLGGGTQANIFQNILGFHVDAVELDERVAEVARQYFALSNNVNVIVDDARHYLEQTNKKYDVVVFDVYRGESPPPHVFTVESLKKAKSLLKKDGLIIVNFNGFLEGRAGIPARSIYKTLLAAGLEVRILPATGAEATGTNLFVASRNKQDFRTLRASFSQSGKPVDIETLFYDPKKPDLNDAVSFTDDKPILELLNIPAGNAWRKAYTEMTKTFYKEGVPLFR